VVIGIKLRVLLLFLYSREYLKEPGRSHCIKFRQWMGGWLGDHGAAFQTMNHTLEPVTTCTQGPPAVSESSNKQHTRS
jgi:hypothetical protein